MLPYPLIEQRSFGRVRVLTDDGLAASCGVRIAFTLRGGGASLPPFDSLNLGGHVGDDPAAVGENRRLLAEALGADPQTIVVARQVHGTEVVVVPSAGEAALAQAREQAAGGADAVVVSPEATGASALLCFADCVPVVVASPTGAFAVAHAGWRGAVARICSKAVRALEKAGGGDPSACNAYIGPCIRKECFEVGEDVAEAFSETFGAACVPDRSHVDLPAAVACDLVSAGIDRARIADAGECTVCGADRFFSYRASGGSCGRHGAFAVRLSREEGMRS